MSSTAPAWAMLARLSPENGCKEWFSVVVQVVAGIEDEQIDSCEALKGRNSWMQPLRFALKISPLAPLTLVIIIASVTLNFAVASVKAGTAIRPTRLSVSGSDQGLLWQGARG